MIATYPLCVESILLVLLLVGLLVDGNEKYPLCSSRTDTKSLVTTTTTNTTTTAPDSMKVETTETPPATEDEPIIISTIDINGNWDFDLWDGNCDVLDDDPAPQVSCDYGVTADKFPITNLKNRFMKHPSCHIQQRVALATWCKLLHVSKTQNCQQHCSFWQQQILCISGNLCSHDNNKCTRESLNCLWLLLLLPGGGGQDVWERASRRFSLPARTEDMWD